MGGSRRQSLLAATAFAGVLATFAAIAPQSAFAACTVVVQAGTGDNIIRCDTATTVNSVYPTNAGTDRVYNWTTLTGFGNINAGTIFPGAGNPKVDGAGLEFNGFTGGGAGVDVSFNNLDSGAVNQTVAATVGPSVQSGALSLITRGGGNISYTGNGAVTTVIAGAAALEATVQGTGNINIGSAASPISGATFSELTESSPPPPQVRPTYSSTAAASPLRLETTTPSG